MSMLNIVTQQKETVHTWSCPSVDFNYKAIAATVGLTRGGRPDLKKPSFESRFVILMYRLAIVSMSRNIDSSP